MKPELLLSSDDTGAAVGDVNAGCQSVVKPLGGKAEKNTMYGILHF